MANVGFFVIGGLGLCFLALGLFPGYFGERFHETASFSRILGVVLLAAAFTVRSVLQRQGRDMDETEKLGEEAGNSQASDESRQPERRRD